MTTLSRILVQLTGTGVVGGGQSSFHVPNGEEATAIAALATFYGVVAANSPDNVTFSIPNSGVTIDDTTGDVNGAWSGGTSPTPFTGAATTGFQMGVGARVRWNTPGTRNGRHVIGPTFLVPLASSAYTTDGFLLPAVSSALSGAAMALLAAQEFLILSRPTGPLPDGASWTAVAGTVPLNVSWLRSRRT